MNLPQDEPMERLTFQTSCERCRTRKIKCDRIQPCARCENGNHECTFRGNGEKQRPVSKAQMQALEAEIKSLRAFIGRLSKANSSERDEMLATFNAADPQTIQQTPAVEVETPAINDRSLTIRPRAGHLRRLRDGKAAQFFGATSFFQINPSEDQEEPFSAAEVAIGDPSATLALGLNIADLDMDIYSQLAYALVPQSEICLRLMATFFMKQYHYHMCVYREYFLRDFDAGGGPYYSDLLMYAICAMGALASEDPNLRSLSEIFASRAQELLYGSACLCSPNLTTLQALLLLGHREIGRGKASKGWLFSGMAFRLAHEMGLHLDPSNWKGSRDSRIDREILRRVYWAAFIADKQLSLYFGRPPALYPGESDVRNTIRIPYPPEWATLLDKYLMKGTSETAYEDGVALVGTWIYQAELSKIQHRMITEVFENRNIKTDPAVLATSITQIHVSLTKWLADLPSKLHWTKWTVGPIPSNIIQLHLVYHTSLIILRRPPRHSLSPKNHTNTPPPSINQNKSPPSSSTDDSDIETCYTSLSIIIRLLKIYARHYAYNQLPLTIVHTLASAASVLLMKRYLENLPWDNVEISKPLELVLSAIDGVSETWPAARQVRQVLESAIKERTSNGNENENATGGGSASDAQLGNTAGVSPGSFDFMSAVGPGLMDDLAFDQMVDVNFGDLDTTDFNAFDPTVLGDDFDLGQLMTDEFMNNELSWGNTEFS